MLIVRSSVPPPVSPDLAALSFLLPSLGLALLLTTLKGSLFCPYIRGQGGALTTLTSLTDFAIINALLLYRI